jgi:hypothetical protein
MSVIDTQPAQITYRTDSDGTVHATFPGNPHELVWTPDPDDPTKGSVRLDGHGRAMALHMPPHPFHVQAETYFSVRHAPPATLLEWQRRWDREAVSDALDAAADSVELRLVEVSEALRYAAGDSPRVYTLASRAFIQYGTGHTTRGFAEAYTVRELAAQMRSVALAVRTQGGTQ